MSISFLGISQHNPKGPVWSHYSCSKTHDPWACLANLAIGKNQRHAPLISPCPVPTIYQLRLTNRGQALHSGDDIKPKPSPSHSDSRRPLLRLQLEHEKFLPPGRHSECVELRLFLAGGLCMFTYVYVCLCVMCIPQNWKMIPNDLHVLNQGHHQSLDDCDPYSQACEIGSHDTTIFVGGSHGSHLIVGYDWFISMYMWLKLHTRYIDKPMWTD